MCEFISNFASALLGATAALGGTYLTLRHQSDAAKEQRQFEQRRTEYARFIETISRAVRDLSSATNLDYAKLESSPGLMEFSESVGRLYLFASPPVIEKALLFSKGVTGYISKLFGYIIRASQHQADLDATHVTIERLTKQEADLRQVIQEQALAPSHPTSVQWKMTSDALVERLHRSAEMIRSGSLIRLEAYRSLIQNYKSVVPTYIELVAAMRLDLCGGDTVNISDALKKSSEAGIEHLEGLMKQLEEVVIAQSSADKCN